MNHQIYHHKHPFTTESGFRFSELEIAYATWGTRNATGSNAVLLCHALTGNADAEEWFSGLFKNNQVLNPNNDFIICSNVLGSCYGTTGPKSINPETSEAYSGHFPFITIRDMVRVQQLLFDHLGITQIQLGIGASMGGMQVLEWLLMDTRLKSAVLIGMGKAHSAWAIGTGEAQRAAIYADPKWNGGFYSDMQHPDQGLAVARMMGMLSYRSPESFERRFGRMTHQASPYRFNVESYLHYQGAKLTQRFDANTYVRLTRAMDRHDVARNRADAAEVLSSVTQPVLVVGISSDWLYPTNEQKELANLLGNARYAELISDEGHDAFLIEFDKLNELIAPFRKQISTND